MKTKQTKLSKKPRLLTISIAFLATAVMVNAALTAYLLSRNRVSDDFKLAYMIVSAVENLNTPLAIDPVSGKGYIPIAKLVLPPTDSSLGEVLYRYEPGNNTDMPTEIQIASKYNISRYASAVIAAPSVNGDPKVIFERVPKLQACVRGVTILFESRDGEKAVATKLLSNGKTAHFYTENDCPNAELLNYAKQIDSY